MQTLTQDETRAHLADLIAISADVSDWGAAQFLKDLPRKWDLSFWNGSDGYCILSVRNGAIHINQLMIDAKKRGSGIGSKLLAEAVRRGAKTLKVHPDNTGARRLYERHGWIETARENGYSVYGHVTDTAAATCSTVDAASIASLAASSIRSMADPIAAHCCSIASVPAAAAARSA